MYETSPSKITTPSTLNETGFSAVFCTVPVGSSYNASDMASKVFQEDQRNTLILISLGFSNGFR